MADKPPYTRKYRVLKDFTDRAGNRHKKDDEIDLDPSEAQAHVNADLITAELRPSTGSGQGKPASQTRE